MKIILEDKVLEEYVMDGKSDVGVPISLYIPDGEEAVITVYSKFERVAKEYWKKFSENPFSKEALEFLDDEINPVMEDAGYFHDTTVDWTTHRFTAEKGYRNRAVCDYKIVRIDTTEQFESYINSLTQTFTFDENDELDVCFAVVHGNTMLSYACVNDILDEGCYEITVETNPFARGLGCGTAAVSALCEYITSKGERASYICRSSNKASKKLAENAGLTHVGTGYNFVCYNEEVEDIDSVEF